MGGAYHSLHSEFGRSGGPNVSNPYATWGGLGMVENPPFPGSPVG